MPTKKKIVFKKKINEQPSTTAEETPPKHTKKVCKYCQAKSRPNFVDVSSLRHFLTDRGRIIARTKTNLCSKHQRLVTKHIKYARHLALLPFTLKV